MEAAYYICIEEYMRNDKQVPNFVRNREAKPRQYRDFYRLHSRSVSRRSRGIPEIQMVLLEKQTRSLEDFSIYCAMEFPLIIFID